LNGFHERKTKTGGLNDRSKPHLVKSWRVHLKSK